MDTPSGVRSGKNPDWFSFWVVVWLGTTGASGVFGLVLLGGVYSPKAALVGLLSAAVCAGPVVGTTAVVAWALWLSRFRVALAAFGGGLTGLVYSYPLVRFFNPLVLLGAIVAGAVGGVVAAEIHRRTIAAPGGEAHVGPSRPWQFSLRDLFVRIAVLAVTLSVWIWLVRSVGFSF
jgi:hypothetical protein